MHDDATPPFVPDNVAVRHNNPGGPDDGVFYRNDKGKAVTGFLDGRAEAVFRTDLADINMSPANQQIVQRLRRTN